MFQFPDKMGRPILAEVPAELMRYTTNIGSFDDFQRSGHEVYIMMEAAARKHNGMGLHEHDAILDFGCGAGRILQFIPEGAALAGCDVNGPLVEFTARRFPEADIYRNEFQPPLKWADGTFDLIYSFSVFSHLRLEDEQRWLAELARVARPGCLFLITVHGDWFIHATMSAAEQDAVRSAGFVYREVHKRTGSEMDFPEGYEASFHTSEFIRANWGSQFDVLEIYLGNSAPAYGWTGMSPRLKPILDGLRPMGQDLVVMRKR